MSLTLQEERLIGQAEDSLASGFFDKELLTTLLKQYKRTIKRLDKIMKLSDRQQLELMSLNEELDEHKKHLLEKTHKISSLLDNADEGFLSFGTDMRVQNEFSAECTSMLSNDNITDSYVYELLFPTDEYLQDLFIGGVTQAFASDDEYFSDIFIELLPKETVVHSKHLNLKYKRIEQNQMMVIINDITEQRKLEAAIEEERDKLSFVVAVIKDKHNTFETIDAFKTFRKKKLHQIIEENKDTGSVLSELYKEIHTYKGVFAQLKFIKTPACLHEIEDKLSRLKSAAVIDKVVLQNILHKKICKEALKEDLGIVIENIGKEFFKNKTTVDIDIKKAKKLETFAKNLLDKIDELPATKDLSETLEKIAKLSHIPFKKLLERYEGYTAELAKKLDKKIAPLKIDGGDFLIDTAHYKELAKAMVHLFRNCIDHGIEEPYIRAEAGKPEQAKITCTIEEKKKNIVIQICDDGRGIDIEKLRSKLGKAAKKINDTEMLDMIFEDSISTKDEIGDLSGRGVGLSALKKAVLVLKGTVDVKSKLGEGTCFKLLIPKSHR